MKTEAAARTLVGWQGLRFNLPPDWTVSALPADSASGYLKVDSPASMFAQIRWQDGRASGQNVTLWGLLAASLRPTRQSRSGEQRTGLQSEVDAFLSKTAAGARKSKTRFDYRLRPVEQLPGKRTEQGFHWTGNGVGHGKAWRCDVCGRTVIAQVVGRARDPVREVAAELFGSFQCHPEDEWTTWAVYDLVAAAPSSFRLQKQSLLSGYLSLEFVAGSGRRIRLERWGLASVTLRKFKLEEWFENRCDLRAYRAEMVHDCLNGHDGFRAAGEARGLNRLRAAREAFPSGRPALAIEAACWHCEETNRIYALRTWRPRREPPLIGELVRRCECH